MMATAVFDAPVRMFRSCAERQLADLAATAVKDELRNLQTHGATPKAA